MKTVIVGLDPGNNDGEPLDAKFSSGRRLADLCGLTPAEFHERFDRVNLHALPGVGYESDWHAARNLSTVLRGRRVVALGQRVARAFSVAGQFEWRVCDWGFVVASMPHPSGLSRWWNDDDNVAVARTFCLALTRPCVHVEGPDGSGKSHLVTELMASTGLTSVDTQGPPDTWTECVSRVEYRLRPGTVCDRSSGLVSELVYGPVLRGGTLVAEDRYWNLVRAVMHAVTFVYCRPPRVRMDYSFRADEPEEFRRSVRDNHDHIVTRYDDVFAEMVRIGCRVVRYDFTTTSVEEVARCVA